MSNKIFNAPIMKNMKKLTYLFLSAMLIAAGAVAEDKPKKNAKVALEDAQGMALVIKTVKSVESREKQTSWKSVKRGDQLNSGSQVKTGAESFSILKFVDGTVIRVQENTEIMVRGDKDTKSGKMDKGVDLNLGRIGFNVKKRPDEQFRFSSPTSVASIKGTAGVRGVDFLLILEGSAEMSLPNGSGTKQVGAGQIAEVKNGVIEVRQATQDEINVGKKGIADTGTGKVIIDFRNKNGDIETIEITPGQ
jgi:hypothetical protein